jgi:hypothetical protein
MPKWILSRRQARRLALVSVGLIILCKVAHVYVSRSLGDWLSWIAMGLVWTASVARKDMPKDGPP